MQTITSSYDPWKKKPPQTTKTEEKIVWLECTICWGEKLLWKMAVLISRSQKKKERKVAQDFLQAIASASEKS